MSTSKLNWNSPLSCLSKKKTIPKNLQKLIDAGFKQIKDLLWIFPLRSHEVPTIKSFDALEPDKLFHGEGKVISKKVQRAFNRRGKKNIPLFNISLFVQDHHSHQTLTLKWFNTYPNLRKQLEEIEHVEFLGEATLFKASFQIINPKINQQTQYESNYIIEYPTVNTVSGPQIKKYIDLIPDYLWDTALNTISTQYSEKEELIESFKKVHRSHQAKDEEVKNRLIYEDFYHNQLKVLARRISSKRKLAPKLNTKPYLTEAKNYFPYQLTTDQETTLQEVTRDLSSGTPMMRLVQGDVGCGKTSVALVSAYATIKEGYQVAFMCPTETLARQHYKTFKETFGDTISCALLIGSTKNKERKTILEGLESAEISFVIGTHTLFQDSVKFKKLGLSIIDEQHKFGVLQRIKLVEKGEGTHCLLMTATPIPRTLQLAQYGDLDISSIKSIPAGRKGIQTRIVKENNYEKYLSFIKTRIEIGEQVYIVAPAITESETLDIKNVEEIYTNYQKFFPHYKIATLHGQMSSEEKNEVMLAFQKGDIKLLISTSVIEVGINVTNATVMALYGPERFGLSSIHQLRGRVGRGSKPGFCFLIVEKKVSQESLERLKIIEKNTDGFVIAEADLQNRGQGDLFGVDQSGVNSNYKLANLFDHFSIFQLVSHDIERLKDQHTNDLHDILSEYIEDLKVSSTV